MLKDSSGKNNSLTTVVVKSTFGKALTVIFDTVRNLVFIKFLSVELFGLLSICNNVVQSSKYFDLGFANKFLIDAYDGKLSGGAAKRVFSAIILFEFLFLSLVGYIFFLFFLNKTTFSLPAGAEGLGLVVIVLVGLTLLAARLFKLSIIWRRHVRQYVKIAQIEFGLSAVMLGLSLVAFREDFSLFLKIYFFGQLCILLLSSLVTFRNINVGKLAFSWLKENIRVSLTLTSATLIFGLSFYLDRYILLNYFSFTELGYYAVLLFVLNIANTLISYMVEPIRANLAKLFSSGDAMTRSLMLDKIAFYAGVALPVGGILLIKLFMPVFSHLALILAPQYALVFSEFEMVFMTALTFPLVFILGYLIVADPYKKTGFFAISQFSGVIAISASFWILKLDQSIYWVLLLGIYYGNVLKIYSYFVVMDLERGSLMRYAKSVFFMVPLTSLPWI